ncbi:DNA sulfur modification protein DndD [Fictibacillus sp. 23RED33]|uniref:DNA sulfur modification protein DndD n=1 Tax=Fictibacillus sp. 23RED33 TaxID=2745879 RepID=UPI0018CCE9C5|nr:DNA sulfur modification protein DndD [Fictibacillus sp. 23RED33]MBH0175869.1 DNA sulfur modification protein DndD [Fictibacillus sp. 23RED33]
MLLKKVVFNDFRLYQGQVEIDLSIAGNDEKNIILIGALNGSGKTSFLEGILLALYGEQAKLTSGESFEQFIRESINVESYRKGNRKFSIEVTFLESNNVEDNLVIRREWRIRESDCIEQLSIKQNDNEMKQFEDEIEKTQFIQSIIPFGVSQFFFFDGEKIQTIAEDNDSDDSLASSIRDILNINVYQQLVDDLYAFEQNQKRSQADVKKSDIIKIEAEIEVTKENIQEIEKELDNSQLKNGKLNMEIIEIKKWLREQGIRSLNKRSDIQEELEKLKQEREEIRDQVISYLDNEFSYVLLFPLLEETLEQIQKESEFNKAKLLSRQSHENFYSILNTLNSNKITPKLTPFQKETIAAEIQLVWATIQKPIIIDDVKILHDLSNTDLSRLKAEIQSTITYLSNGNSNLEKTLELYQEIINKINEKHQLLKTLPTNDLVLQKESQLEALEQNQKNIENKIRLYQSTLDELNVRKKNQQNQRTELLDQVKVSMDIQKKIDESGKVRKTLDSFISMLTIEKAREVENLLTEMFNKLTRKDYLVKKFEINPYTFNVTFENMSGEILPKRRLSAGEKEIFSIALVWALAKASQKPLPIVIDTPLGRLDKIHRTNLLTHYFPHASQQVIILSTDEEVADEWKSMIQKNIAKEYLITDEGEKSLIKEGYFNTLEV